MKKTRIQYLLGALIIAVLTFTACTEDNSMTVNNDPNQKSDTEIKSDDPVIIALSNIPGVHNVSKKYSDIVEYSDKGAEKTDSVYIFYIDQPIDYKNASKGTYEHRCKLHFKGFDKNVVVYTNGYAMEPECLPFYDLAVEYDANQLDIEHRYFGESLPENFEDLHMTYFDADQQAHNIHNIVSTLRKELFKKGKWLSTGTSKCGITTALQAYYSDLYGWKDFDVFVPFCAPFIKGITINDGSFCCEDNELGTYLWKVCGNGYAKGTPEQIAYERLLKIPYYVCTNEKIRQSAIKATTNADPAGYAKILKQFNEKSSYSTGDLTKDLAAFSLHMYYAALNQKFSSVQYSIWKSLVPDPEFLASDKATDEDFIAFEKFYVMDEEALKKEIENLKGSRATEEETYWNFLVTRRKSSSAPYYIQAFKELGYFGIDYSTVDGQYLTAQQCFNVNYQSTIQAIYNGVYKQDKGKLMTDFREWVKTEKTMPIVFVYAHNDGWTGAGITPDRTGGNSMIVSIVDGIATHNDYFRNDKYYEPKTRQAIVEAINKFIK